MSDIFLFLYSEIESRGTFIDNLTAKSKVNKERKKGRKKEKRKKKVRMKYIEGKELNKTKQCIKEG